MNRKYSPEMRERALRMLAETRPSHPTMMSAVRHVAGLLGMSPETLRLWQRQYEVDAGVKPGLTTDAAAEIKRLQKENVELATLEYVWWWNTSRLHGELDMRTPHEVEHAYYADLESAQPALPDKAPDRNESQADSMTGIFRPDWSTDPACTNMPVGYQCDEFPYFSTEEGHPEPVDLRPIPAGDNASQGGHLTAFYPCPLLSDSAQESADRRFLVVPLPFPLPTLTYCPPRLP